MAYKDEDRQRAYQREWVRQKRQGSTGSTGRIKLKGQTPGITICPGITIIDEPPSVIPYSITIPPQTGCDFEKGRAMTADELPKPVIPKLSVQTVIEIRDRMVKDKAEYEANRLPLTKERQVSKQGFNT